MKYLFSILGTFGFVIPSAAVLAIPNINVNENKAKNDYLKSDLTDDYTKLGSFTQDEVKSLLIQNKENVIFDENKLEDLLSKKGVKDIKGVSKIFENYIFKDKTIIQVLELLFPKQSLVDVTSTPRVYSEWKFKIQYFWFTYITAYWIIDINGPMAKDFASGFTTAVGIAQIIEQLTKQVPSLSNATAQITKIIQDIAQKLETFNKDNNGIQISILGLIPVNWVTSAVDWAKE
ncbi:hypothetical protein [Spiroplasma alleghenense]|uniref:Chitinase n=1 Tax=Spiroplasma alleghenense TaxID=216931 RepID=A0A345Z4K5_9MOLU|nr:hypothetical protein [Spiroplasma alleghenense]AXK51534.1 hypothetical protein SALLE_v1c08640 [Spiroplasma alleghenense]